MTGPAIIDGSIEIPGHRVPGPKAAPPWGAAHNLCRTGGGDRRQFADLEDDIEEQLAALLQVRCEIGMGPGL